MRLENSTPELDAKEIEWWKEFAEIEDRFCWVQTPAIQHLIRGHYLSEILKLGRGGRIAEIGCGTGWLCIQLGKLGASAIGLDFSAAQIAIARDQAKRMAVENRVRFEVADAKWFEATEERFSLVIMHGFLHHLATSEIRAAISSARCVLDNAGTLVVIEPVAYPPPANGDRKESRCLGWLQRLMYIQLQGQRWGLRRISPAEKHYRDRILAEPWGISPHGPSPKELPFAPDELPKHLELLFEIRRRSRVMAMSHFVARENILLELSHPWRARAIRWPLLKMTSWLDRRLLRDANPPPGSWIFEMFVCTPKQA